MNCRPFRCACLDMYVHLTICRQSTEYLVTSHACNDVCSQFQAESVAHICRNRSIKPLLLDSEWKTSPKMRRSFKSPPRPTLDVPCRGWDRVASVFPSGFHFQVALPLLAHSKFIVPSQDSPD